MKFALIGLTALVMATASGTARADWQYTKWGMTPDEVLRAAPASDEVHEGSLTFPSASHPLIGRYSAERYNFNTLFWFGDRGLYAVSLNLAKDSFCFQLEESMMATYGTPTKRGEDFPPSIVYGREQGYVEWEDKGKNAVVRFFTGTDSVNDCPIVYRPLPAPPQKVDGL